MAMVTTSTMETMATINTQFIPAKVAAPLVLFSFSYVYASAVCHASATIE